MFSSSRPGVINNRSLSSLFNFLERLSLLTVASRSTVSIAGPQSVVTSMVSGPSRNDQWVRLAPPYSMNACFQSAEVGHIRGLI